MVYHVRTIISHAAIQLGFVRDEGGQLEVGQRQVGSLKPCWDADVRHAGGTATCHARVFSNVCMHRRDPLFAVWQDAAKAGVVLMWKDIIDEFVDVPSDSDEE